MYRIFHKLYDKIFKLFSEQKHEDKELSASAHQKSSLEETKVKKTYCMVCGKDNPVSEEYCLACGMGISDMQASKLVKVCLICGLPSSNNFVYCANCGTKFEDNDVI
jgi:ribosomal protein L40E